MSLILYGDESDKTNDNDGDGDDEYNVILHNRHSNTLVLHNKHTEKLVLINNSLAEVEKTCPHCGSKLKAETNIDTEQLRASPDKDNYGAIHANYFRLLGNAIETRESTPLNKHAEEEFIFQNKHLPSSIFQQGYYSNFFKEMELLGKGSRGSVYKVEHLLNGVSLGIFALKKITIGDDSSWLLKVLNEVNMLVKISYNNKNLVNYNHVWLEIDCINEFGPRVPCAFILQQYCSGGSLESFVQNIRNPILTVKEMKKHHIKRLVGRYLTNEEILLIFTDLVNGVSELHKNHIIHRDLKPSNCLMSHGYLSKFELSQNPPDLTRLPTALIGDFGESQLEGEIRTASGYTGTIEYSAPELFSKKNQFSKKTDIYSLGMILYFLCFSGIPFRQTLNLKLLQDEIRNFKILETRGDLHPDFVELIKKLTYASAFDRPETEEILKILEYIGGDLENTNATDDITVAGEIKDQFPADKIQDSLNGVSESQSQSVSKLSSGHHELLDESYIDITPDEGGIKSLKSTIRPKPITLFFENNPKLITVMIAAVEIVLLKYGIIQKTPEWSFLHYGSIFCIGLTVREGVRACLFLSGCLAIISFALIFI